MVDCRSHKPKIVGSNPTPAKFITNKGNHSEEV